MAAGDFDYRIHLLHDDEMSELADAMNDMTARFRADSRRSRSPGAGAHQAGGAQRAVGQRRLSGGRRGARNQQSAGLDRACAPNRWKAGARLLEVGTSSRRRRPQVMSQLSADDSGRGLPLQRNHRAAARFLAPGRCQAAAHRSARAGAGRHRHGGPPRRYHDKRTSSSPPASR